MDASRTLARQAAERLDARAAAGDSPDVAQLAQTLGVSDRHLRRIFLAEHGVTPVQYLQTRRLLLAKQLLTDTQLPITQVALASGFKSVRRFNAAFADSYRMNPSRLRQRAEGQAPVTDGAVTMSLSYRAPYDRASLLRFFALRAIPGIECVDAHSLRRSVRGGVLAESAGWIEAKFDADAAKVHLRFAPQWALSSARVAAAARRWLDLDASPQSIDNALAALPGAPGLRLPGSLDPFELAVRAVLGQQVTVAAARTLAHRFVARFGDAAATPWDDVTRSFPAPQVLADTAVAQIAELSIIRTRAAAIIALSQAWSRLSEHFGSGHLGGTHTGGHAAPEALITQLRELPGIGPWTAHYIAMRALSWPDAFPPQDVAVLKAMKQLWGTASQRDADSQAQAWQPWRAYAVLKLWNSLEKPA